MLISGGHSLHGRHIRQPRREVLSLHSQLCREHLRHPPNSPRAGPSGTHDVWHHSERNLSAQQHSHKYDASKCCDTTGERMDFGDCFG